MKNAIQPLAKSVFDLFEIKTAASAAGTEIHEKNGQIGICNIGNFKRK